MFVLKVRNMKASASYVALTSCWGNELPLVITWAFGWCHTLC